MAGLQAQPPRKRSDGENAAPPVAAKGRTSAKKRFPCDGQRACTFILIFLLCFTARPQPASDSGHGLRTGPLPSKVRFIKIRTAARADPGYCCTDINIIYLSCYMSARALCMLRPAAALNKKHLQSRFPLRRCRLNAYGASNGSNTLCLRPYADVCLGSRQGIARLQQPNKNNYHLVSHRKMP